MSDIKYVHEEVVHNYKAASEIIPFLIKLLEPKSVIDVGCGIGTWLKVFKDNGVENILGVDGDYVDRKLLKIEKENFVDFNLETLFVSKEKYDLAISLEVAEHLSYFSADVFVETLIGLSDIIVFSAAIPNQGGQNHVNEQEPKYWIEKFEKKGFKLYDILRPIFWENENVDPWYKQNVFIFSNKSSLDEKLSSFQSFRGTYLVHPYIFNSYSENFIYYKNQFDKINLGKKNVKYYFQILYKSLKNKFAKIIYDS
ncbi:methyltransferase domain-containing protein [Flavobacterium sp. YJ01]|uniref:methyltransferase domain-containing protein n=1 Tax=unclassified Flavobacterium TaxID=196869 RepID=UPI0023E43EF6|nr:methyltransferase domain-containing protein [Flavobacterium sp. YJ01]WET01225.1 methyltransferase domain-containing protein [Flavobacterium sp. YJ01]